MRRIELLIATTNPGKIREIRTILNSKEVQFKLFSLADLNIQLDCPETGSTFMENARQKGVFYSSKVSGLLTVGDDSGLSVAALAGAPGIFSSRYAGEERDDEKNMARLLQELNGFNNRDAKFVTAVSLCKNGKFISGFSGEVAGEILREKRGTQGFGYDPLFFHPHSGKTFAELSTAEKNRFSHRARAFEKLKGYFIKQ